VKKRADWMVDSSVLCRKKRERKGGRRKLKLSSSLFSALTPFQFQGFACL
jgi:hypothetical protein